MSDTRRTYSALAYRRLLLFRGSIIKINQHALMRFVCCEVVRTKEQNIVETNVSVQDSYLTAGRMRYYRNKYGKYN